MARKKTGKLRQPTRGLELFSVFVFAFHPSFVTAGDRAFAVHCLFQQEQITVSARFDFISDIVPKAVLGATSSLPKVDFTIVQGRVPSGAKVVGQVPIGHPLMLVWALDEESKLYGLRMLECTAETHDGRGMNIIRDGCTVDSTLISDIRSDHLLLTGKSEDHLCDNTLKCNANSRRLRRNAASRVEAGDENVIVVTGRLTVDDDPVVYNYAAQVASTEPSTVCLAKDTMALGSAVSVTVCVSTLLTVASLIYSKVKIPSSQS
ncbi:hypothetical protein TELCIR_08428 [Teladorsagia circumcincta]|uniref:Cuticlin N-terminal domain-containing protein n=1 Tax=Teladorsagia circumcincta TaxID=45464 RepID=A0A2G9UJQ6_TELCI|nr:hypothetical protein TELCIR_08428 [Teladorsagia circumcincta]